MTHEFDLDTRRAVLAHMNADHLDDNLLIVRAFGPDPAAVSAVMAGFDGDGGEWVIAGADGISSSVRIAWPGGAIAERREVRREVVALYDAACERLGVTPRPH
ncbi:MAG: hypothetical protein K0R81_2665 [Microbacterium sp.]|jgi:hypothetical protein|nr:hypothetical protein [Microbacterium sp.]